MPTVNFRIITILRLTINMKKKNSTLNFKIPFVVYQTHRQKKKIYGKTELTDNQM